MLDRDELKRLACEEIDRRGAEITGIAQDILVHPEPGFREVRTARVVADFLGALRLTPRTGVAVTGVIARMEGGGSGPNIAIMGELDSLIVPGHRNADPETGAAHACGHHCQIGSMLGAAAGLRAQGVLEALSGSVTVIAAPAEEYIEIEHRNELRQNGEIEFLGGKQELIRLGELDDVDIAMLTHTGGDDVPGFGVPGSNNGMLGKSVQFVGRAAHAGGAPHLGVNALNAAHIALGAIHAQRETFRDADTVRIHPIITRGGASVNSVPADIRMETYVRAASVSAMIDANEKVDRALRAGALAVGGEVVIRTLPGYLPARYDPSLAEIHAGNAASLVGEEKVVKTGHRTGSTDMGDVSQLLPAIQPNVGGVRGRGHGDDYVVHDYGLAVLGAAKAMAMTVIDLAADGAVEGRRIVNDFKPPMTRTEYLSLLRGLASERRHSE